MQAILILPTLEVLPPQLCNSPVIRPKEEADDGIDNPGTRDHGPEDLTGHELRRHLHEPAHVEVVPFECLHVPCDDVDRNEDRTADERQYEKHVAAHVDEANEYGGVEADLIYQGLLSCLNNGCDPSEQAFADRWRSMLLVCMSQPWSVNDGIPGS